MFNFSDCVEMDKKTDAIKFYFSGLGKVIGKTDTLNLSLIFQVVGRWMERQIL